MKNGGNIFKIIIICWILLLTINQSLGTESMDLKNMNKLYVYSRNDLLTFLKEIGHPEYKLISVTDVRRNSLGTELRFFQGQKALIISCGRFVKEISLPSNYVWLNDENHPLAWYDTIKNQVYYNNGMSEKPPFMADYRADPTGIYFMKSVEGSLQKEIPDGTAIYSIDAPDVPLAIIMEFHGQRIFSKDGKVFVFGNYFDRRDQQMEMYIFARKGHELVQLEKVIIPRPRKSPTPFYTEDFCPWKDEVLFADPHDFFLLRTELYTYNIKTHEMKKIGNKPFGGGYGFYLQCDIIKKVTEEYKKKKGLDVQ